MMRKSMIALLLPALFLYCFVSIMAQQRATLKDKASRVESAIQTKEATWKLNRQFRTARQAFHAWSLSDASTDPTGRQKIEYSIFELDSTVKAYEFLHQWNVSAGHGQDLKNVGEKAEIWDNAGPHGETMIHFRQGSNVVYISGPSSAIARRFARHVAAALAN